MKNILCASSLNKAFLALISVIESVSYAAGGGGVPHAVNFYQILLNKMGIDTSDPMLNEWQAVPGTIVITLLIIFMGMSYKKYVDRKVAKNDFAPDEGLSLSNILDLVGNFVYDLAKEQIGEKHFKPYLGLVFSLFIFIFTSNLLGLVPGFSPPTGLISMNLAMGVVVFLAYNWAGIKEHGVSYVKQFLGPVAWLAPLLLIIEIVGHLIRPYSLSLRLVGNLFGDHLVLAVFTDLTWVIMPSILLFFGLLVSFVQSFIFTLLTTIYIGLAVSHDH